MGTVGRASRTDLRLVGREQFLDDPHVVRQPPQRVPQPLVAVRAHNATCNMRRAACALVLNGFSAPSTFKAIHCVDSLMRGLGLGLGARL